MNDWQKIWNKRSPGESNLTLEELIRLDGYDTGAGTISDESWRMDAYLITSRVHSVLMFLYFTSDIAEV